MSKETETFDVFHERGQVIITFKGLSTEPRLDFVIKISPTEAFKLASRLREEATLAKESK
jgi:hypothetical protein